MSVLQTKTEQGGEWESMLQVSRKLDLPSTQGLEMGPHWASVSQTEIKTHTKCLMLKNKQQHPINTQKDIFLYTSCQLNMGHLFSSLLNNNNKNQNLQLTQANGIILGLCISN